MRWITYMPSRLRVESLKQQIHQCHDSRALQFMCRQPQALSGDWDACTGPGQEPMSTCSQRPNPKPSFRTLLAVQQIARQTKQQRPSVRWTTFRTWRRTTLNGSRKPWLSHEYERAIGELSASPERVIIAVICAGGSQWCRWDHHTASHGGVSHSPGSCATLLDPARAEDDITYLNHVALASFMGMLEGLATNNPWV